MDDDARDGVQRSEEPAGGSKRAWATPEIVDVGDVLEVTEAVNENLSDSASGSGMVSYKKGYGAL